MRRWSPARTAPIPVAEALAHTLQIPSTMKTIAILPLFLVACATGPDAADDGFRHGSKADDPWGWSHVVLESGQGNGFSVDYISTYERDSRSYKPTNVDHASPLYVNVWGEELTGAESVRVVVSNRESCSQTILPDVYTVDLTWYEDHFSADLLHEGTVDRPFQRYDDRFITRKSGYAGDDQWCQSAAVVIDGTWQTDPIGGKNEFNFDLYADR